MSQQTGADNFMKKITITQRLIKNNGYYEIRDTLDVRWAKLCEKLNYIPVLLPTCYDFKPYFRSLKIGGIILTGGNDLSLLSPDDELSGKRDAFEKKLIRFGIQKKIPIIGVCRGMQIIADYFHGGFKKVLNHTGTKHKLTVSDLSKYKDILKKFTSVNSYHNYGIKNLSADFVISAKSEDGIIEAIEHKKYRIFGQMWHPERENPFRETDLNLIKKLFK